MTKFLLHVISLTILLLLSACESIAQPSTSADTRENVVETADQAERGNRRPDGPQRGARPGPGNTVAAPVPDIDPNALEVYKTIDGVELNAHIFNPEGHSSSDSQPVMIFLHGGALRFGSPTEGYELAERFIPEGVVVISAEYRLLGTNAETLDQLVSDTKSIIRWTRENADRLGVDPEKVLVSGHGSGAYLTMLAVVLDGHNELSDNLAISSMPDSVIFWSLLTTRRDNPRSSMVPEGYTMADFSAPEVVKNGLPPALFIHGELDPAVSPELALAFQEKYHRAGNQSSYHSIEGADHVFADPGHKAQVLSLISDYMINLGYITAD